MRAAWTGAGPTRTDACPSHRDRVVGDLVGRRAGGDQDVPCPRSPQPDRGEVAADVADRDVVVVSVCSQPGHLRRQVAGAGHDAEPVIREARDGHVGDHPAALVAPLRVDDAADGPVDVVGADALEQTERARPLDGDLAERRQVDDARPLADRARLCADALEPGRPRPAVGGLVAPGAAPATDRVVVVGPLPAGLRPEHRARLLEPPVERRQPPRAARHVRVVRVAQPVVVGVRLARQPGREARIAVRVAEPPRPVRPDVHARIAGRDPAGHRAPDPSPTPEPVERQSRRDPEPANPGEWPEQRVRIRRHRVGVADQPDRLRVGEEREAPDRARPSAARTARSPPAATARRAPTARRPPSARPGSSS